MLSILKNCYNWRKRSSSSSVQNSLKFLKNKPLHINERLQKLKGVLLMTGQINKILTNLKMAIERIANEEGNKNGKIDTLSEKNKIAELLAGAKQEVGDFLEKENVRINNTRLTKMERETQIKELNYQKSSTLDKIKNVEAGLVGTHEVRENGKIKNVENLKHILKGGGYDVKSKEFDDGSYSAIVYDNDNNLVGVRLYKNDKEQYADKNFVAQKLGYAKLRIIEPDGLWPKTIDTGHYRTGNIDMRWDEQNAEFRPTLIEGLTRKNVNRKEMIDGSVKNKKTVTLSFEDSIQVSIQEEGRQTLVNLEDAIKDLDK